MAEPPLPTLKRDEDKWWRLTDQLTHVETRHRILRLVRDGATAEEVSQILAMGDPSKGIAPVHYTPTAVSSFVKGYLNKVHKDDALSLEQLRALENIRLDDLHKKLVMKLYTGEGDLNLKVVDRIVRLSERRAKMNGVDAAQKHEHFVGKGLDALGIEAEHVKQAEEAFITAYTNQGIPDVQVVEEVPELPEGSSGENDGADHREAEAPDGRLLAGRDEPVGGDPRKSSDTGSSAGVGLDPQVGQLGVAEGDADGRHP